MLDTADSSVTLSQMVATVLAAGGDTVRFVHEDTDPPMHQVLEGLRRLARAAGASLRCRIYQGGRVQMWAAPLPAEDGDPRQAMNQIPEL